MTTDDLTDANKLRLLALWFDKWDATAYADLRRIADRMESAARETPPGTRLILASEDILTSFGTRTEDGYRITAEWGEQRPEGWYEPTFTVHHDEPFPAAPSREDGLERLATLGHKPTGDGDVCLHRWRNRTTRAVHCAFLAGWRAATEETP